jgi:hypothetical protein
MISKSNKISKNLSTIFKNGTRLNDNSSLSENILYHSMNVVNPYIIHKCNLIGAKLLYKSKISLFECQEYYHQAGGPIPNIKNKNVFMKPDGGVYFIELHGKTHPILIIEDKIQGTNDILHEQKKKRQPTGNAIERAAKNIRGAEMIFARSNIFPYVIFASGCDFYSNETISKRLEMMNMGFPNHYIEINTNTTSQDIDTKIDSIIPNINIHKQHGKSIASIFVKAHKLDEMKHGSSSWTKEERIKIIKSVIDYVFQSFTP